MFFNRVCQNIKVLVFSILSTLIINSSCIHASIEEMDDDVSASSAATPTSASLLARMPFKLGFEFQTGPGICLWAEDNNNVQKHPIFSMNETKTKCTLWKVVIDSNEIEFVTEPFSYKEQDLLQKSVDTIFIALTNLEKSINQQKTPHLKCGQATLSL